MVASIRVEVIQLRMSRLNLRSECVDKVIGRVDQEVVVLCRP
jgi:hypothetical protein